MQYTKKICLIGDFSVGKTSLIRRFTEGRFDDSYLSTIGVKVSRKQILLDTSGQVEITFMIWDTAGSEGFSNIVRRYYQGAAGALLVCDLTRAATVQSLEAYARDFHSINAGVPLVILANKVDLVQERAVTSDQLDEINRTLNAAHIYTSAKSGEGVEEGFYRLGRLIDAERSTT
jgi:small GTP-binding protein